MIYNALRGSRGTLCICVSDRAGRELGGSGGGGGGGRKGQRRVGVGGDTPPLAPANTISFKNVCMHILYLHDNNIL